MFLIHDLISSFSSHSSQHILHELLPGASEAEISLALENACGDVDEAAQSLLGQISPMCIIYH